jgi:hypothetical protein
MSNENKKNSRTNAACENKNAEDTRTPCRSTSFRNLGEGKLFRSSLFGCRSLIISISAHSLLFYTSVYSFVSIRRCHLNFVSSRLFYDAGLEDSTKVEWYHFKL